MIKREIEKIFSFIVLLILLVLFFLVEDGVSDSVIIVSLVIFYGYLSKVIAKPIIIHKDIKSFLGIDFLFLLFTYIVFYYPYQLYLFDLYDLGVKSNPYYPAYIENSNKALILTTIGIVSFMLGYNTRRYHRFLKTDIRISLKLLDRLSVFFLLMTLSSLFIFVATGGLTMFAGSYIGSDSGSITGNAVFNVVNIFFLLCGINVLYTYLIFKKVSLKNYVLLGLVISWSLLLLILGDRNTFFLIAIALGGGYFTFIKEIGRLKLVGIIIAGLLVYNIVEKTRTLDDKSIGNILTVLTDDDSSTENTYGANSFNTTTTSLRSTFSIVPEQYDFFYGKLKLVALTSIIPYSSRLFVDKDDVSNSSANVISEEMIGLDAGWNTGSNIISDFYMDFGVVGVVLGLLALGYYGGYVKNTLLQNKNNILYFFLYIIILAYYSEISRYGFDFPLRSVVWTLIIFKLVNLNQKRLIN